VESTLHFVAVHIRRRHRRVVGQSPSLSHTLYGVHGRSRVTDARIGGRTTGAAPDIRSDLPRIFRSVHTPFREAHPLEHSTAWQVDGSRRQRLGVHAWGLHEKDLPRVPLRQSSAVSHVRYGAHPPGSPLDRPRERDVMLAPGRKYTEPPSHSSSVGVRGGDEASTSVSASLVSSAGGAAAPATATDRAAMAATTTSVNVAVRMQWDVIMKREGGGGTDVGVKGRTTVEKGGGGS